MNHSEKIRDAKRCIGEFRRKFGEQDIYTKLVLEVLLEELHGKKQSKEALPIPVETRQEGDESFKHFPLQAMPSDQNYRFVKPKTSARTPLIDPEDRL